MGLSKDFLSEIATVSTRRNSLPQNLVTVDKKTCGTSFTDCIGKLEWKGAANYRWVTLFVVCIHCFVSGPAYISWPSIRAMLVRDQAYIWVCPNYSGHSSTINSNQPFCDDQESSIVTLLSLCCASHFVASAIFGCCIDIIGPKYTGIIGVLFGSLGWLLFGVGSRNCNSYIPGVIFIGFGIDAAIFASLSVINLFPRYSFCVIGLMGACRSASFYIPYMMEKLLNAGYIKSFMAASWISVFTLLGISFPIMFTIIPMKPFLPYKKKSYHTVDRTGTDCSLEMDIISENGTVADEKHIRDKTMGEVSGEDQKQTESGFQKVFDTNDWRDILHEIISPTFWPLVIAFSIILQRTMFFASATHDIFVPTAQEIFKILVPLSFIPCPLFGYLADKLGIIPVMSFLNLTGLLTVIFAFVPKIPAPFWSQILATCAHCITVSLLVSQVYCFATETYPAHLVGRLIGMICCVSGLSALVNIPMYKHSRIHGFSTMMYLLLGETILVFFLILILWWAKRRRIGIEKFKTAEKELKLVDLN